MDSFFKCPGPENALSAVPKIMVCPHCGAEVEIWSDDSQVKCSGCQAHISQEHRNRKEKSDKGYTVELREIIDDAGRSLLFERFETVIPIPDIDYADKNKIACEACHKFGKNFACPPYSPRFEEYVGSHQYARIICIRLPQEYYRELIRESIYEACFRQARAILVEDLLEYRQKGDLIGGCGYCQTCEVCGAEQGIDSCIKPEKMIYSLESMGVNLTDLTKTCFGFDLEWNTNEYAVDFVCSIGAVFYKDLESSQ